MLSLLVEIQVDIFLRLPVKSILNFRYVCKPWSSLLSSSKFVEYHLQHRIQENNPMFLLKRYEKLGFKVPVVYSIDSASISRSSTSCESINEAVLMEYPFQDKSLRFENLGSCNGLICFGIISGRSTIISQDCSVCLWNPSTGEYNNNIPMAPLFDHHHPCYNVRYGVGYDGNTDDYKIVRLANYGNSGRFGDHVYALRSDSWKAVETVRYSFLLANRSPGLPFYGTLHWLVTTATNSEVMLCFDIRNERILNMSFP
ncbi:F-box/kelch-repeat protein At3g23880-like [Papaver somniferum]|uniref:F-box/kelch-repeat protein At3g23880-like n=1 Tax=Papaver somniferum TaxID=3469 RepID=UPI000E6F78F7|nr:F-box/kelch-repeat protein At3g23880-like [Papaver somniferum]